MSYRIETRLALIVSVLAIATVAATAFAIRQGARSELSKASIFRTATGQGITPARVKAVADTLANHCCSPVAIAAGTAALHENEIALVYDATADRPVAQFARVHERISRLDAKRSGSGAPDPRIERRTFRAPKPACISLSRTTPLPERFASNLEIPSCTRANCATG